MTEKLDFKKAYKDLYVPGKKPVLVQVPAMRFLYVEGHGAPEQPQYQNAISIFYSIAFTIKMSRLSGATPPGYMDFTPAPLEGLWNDEPFKVQREQWRWTSMMRMPDYVDEAVIAWAQQKAGAKKPDVDYAPARFGQWEEGLCMQIMHTGPFSEEPHTIELMHRALEEQGYALDMTDGRGLSRRHHEIYLNDPRKTAPERLKTVLRLPVKKL